MNKEIRMLNVEFRAVENEDNKMIIEGYPIVFNSPATHWGMTEIIDSNSLNDCDMTDVPLKYNHDDSHLILARTRNGSLKLEVDSIGLRMSAELIDTVSNQDIYKSVKAGLLDKMSFAFTTKEEKYDYDTDTRTILSIDKLYDVSIVDLPYYDATSLYARKLDNSNEYKNKIDKEKKRRGLLNRIKRSELLNRL